MAKYIDADKLKRFEEMLADIIVSSQGLCTYEACKDVAKSEALVLIESLQQEQQENKPSLLKSLEEYFAKTPKEQLDTDWEKLKVWNEVGPDAITYCKAIREQQKVDLEKEIEEYWIATEWSKVITLGKFKVIARYFYGLGQLNSK